MSVLVNLKICDNADVCSGVEVCPTGAIYWSEKNKTLEFNNSKCTCCGLCADACPAKAIAVASTEAEYKAIKQSFDDDPRTVKDLMVERYGASPVDESIMIPISEANSLIDNNTGLLAIEIVNDSDTACLIDSVPIAELFDDLEYTHVKVMTNDELYNNFSQVHNVVDIPTFLLFSSKQIILKINGVVSNQDQQDRAEFIKKVKDAIGF